MSIAIRSEINQKEIKSLNDLDIEDIVKDPDIIKPKQEPGTVKVHDVKWSTNGFKELQRSVATHDSVLIPDRKQQKQIEDKEAIKQILDLFT